MQLAIDEPGDPDAGGEDAVRAGPFRHFVDVGFSTVKKSARVYDAGADVAGVEVGLAERARTIADLGKAKCRSQKTKGPMQIANFQIYIFHSTSTIFPGCVYNQGGVVIL
jgi:hypothetical protein